MKSTALLVAAVLAWIPLQGAAPAENTPALSGAKDRALGSRVVESMRKAAEYFRTKVARHGGYVYYCSTDLKQRWGEGKAGPDQIWVQPPGTPSVGLAYLDAYEATKDSYYLDPARESANALVRGQLESGGWTNSIDFAAKGKEAPRYRKLPGVGRNYSTLDDGITQNALRLLMRVDRALDFKDAEIHEASEYARERLLKAQFANGGFPQGWSNPVPEYPVKKAAYPEYDWRTENRIKAYWDLPTLNDNLVGHLTETLEEAWTIYQDERCKRALERLGDFLILAQMPDPQPAWAQQYDHEMRPVWARKFEPPAIAGRESIGAMKALLHIHRITRDKKYLEPIPKALAYLERSLLPDGRLARYYELQTNRPLYMNEAYELTYDDSHAPSHYAWKTSAKLDSVRNAYERQLAGHFLEKRIEAPDEGRIREILSSLDAQGRWVTKYEKQGLVGQPKFAPGTEFISSEVFCENMAALSDYLRASR